MHFSKFLLTAAAASLAVAAIAQPSESSDEAPAAEASPDSASAGASSGQDETQSRLEQEAQRQSGSDQPEPAAPAPAPPEPAAPAPEPAAPAPEAAAPAAASAQPAAAPSPPAPPLTRAQIAELERTAERGRLLIAIARAGIVATQDMLSRVSDPEGAGISGWIAEPEGNAMKVTFYADAGAPATVYRANVLGGRVVSREVFLGADRPPLSPVQARMAAARAAASGLDHRPCGGGQFNYLVVPPASATAPVDVYQVTAPSQRGHFPLGGHFRATVAADGAISGARGFSSRCLDLEAPATPPGQPPQPIGITYLMDPMPSEIHVFLSQLIGRPLLVATGEPARVWLATPERIAEVRP